MLKISISYGFLRISAINYVWNFCKTRGPPKNLRSFHRSGVRWIKKAWVLSFLFLDILLEKWSTYVSRIVVKVFLFNVLEERPFLTLIEHYSRGLFNFQGLSIFTRTDLVCSVQFDIWIFENYCIDSLVAIFQGKQATRLQQINSY